MTGRKSWHDWYHDVIEKESGTCEEKLEKCKQCLEMFRDICIRGPFFIENLIEELEFEDIKTDKQKVEDAFDYLLQFEMREVLPVYDWVKQLLENPAETRNRFEQLKELHKLSDAFHKIVFAFIVEQNLWKEITSMREEYNKIQQTKGNNDRLEEIDRSLLELLPHALEGVWDRLFGTRILYVHLMLATTYIRSAVSLLTDRLNAPAARLTFRPSFEVVLRGVLYEHLLVPEFRDEVRNSKGYWLQGGKVFIDSVKSTIEGIEDLARTRNISIEEAIIQHEYILPDARVRTASFHDTMRWLEKWEVFAPNAGKALGPLWNRLNKDAHAIVGSHFRGLAQWHDLKSFHDELGILVDVMLVTALNTVANINAGRLKETLDREWQGFGGDKEVGKTIGDRFKEFAEGGQLEYALEWLKRR